MATGATKRLGPGEYLHTATNCTLRRVAETLWEAHDARLRLVGRFRSKREALDTLDKMSPDNPSTAGESRTEYLARVLTDLVPPSPGYVYRVIELPADLVEQVG